MDEENAAPVFNITPIVQKIKLQNEQPNSSEYLQAYPGSTESQNYLVSDFFIELDSIVEYFKKLIPENIPSLKEVKECWDNRRKELTKLEAALNIARMTHEDAPLILLCRYIAEQKDKRLYKVLPLDCYGIISWNEFPKKISELLVKYMNTSGLTMHLIQHVDSDLLLHNYSKLIHEYHIIYEQLVEVKTQLEASKDYQTVEQRIAKYLQLSNIKDQVLNTLRKDKINLETKNNHLAAENKNLSQLIDSYKRQYSWLQTKLEEVTEKIEKEIEKYKDILDKNKLLNFQVETLSYKNERYQSSIKKQSNEIVALKHSLKETEERNQKLSSDRVALNLELKNLNQIIDEKDIEIAKLRSTVKNLTLKQKTQVKKIQHAALKNGEDLNSSAQKLSSILGDFDDNSEKIDHNLLSITFFGK